ncbi:MAG: MraY family glycosyltransferase, partial [Acidimicrobiales bacterium]
REVSAPAKVAGMVLAASVLYFEGVTMLSFKIPGAGVVVLSPEILPLLTAVWVVGIANAINLIDGLDGLAAGIVAIAAGAFCIYSLDLVHLGTLSTDNLGPLLAVIACGVCLGFLPHNFHPAKVFMGDAGALFIGLLMAASTSVVGGRTTGVSGQTYFFFAPLFIPFLILGVPILDTAFAIVRRTARRSGVSTADKAHLHHRLLQMGHGHRRSVLILWAWTGLLSGFVLYPVFTHRGNAVIPFAAAAVGVALYTSFRPGVWRRIPSRPASSERLAEIITIGEARTAATGQSSGKGRRGRSGAREGESGGQARPRAPSDGRGRRPGRTAEHGTGRSGRDGGGGEEPGVGGDRPPVPPASDPAAPDRR